MQAFSKKLNSVVTTILGPTRVDQFAEHLQKFANTIKSHTEEIALDMHKEIENLKSVLEPKIECNIIDGRGGRSLDDLLKLDMSHFAGLPQQASDAGQDRLRDRVSILVYIFTLGQKVAMLHERRSRCTSRDQASANAENKELVKGLHLLSLSVCCSQRMGPWIVDGAQQRVVPCSL